MDLATQRFLAGRSKGLVPATKKLIEAVPFGFMYDVECLDPTGKLVWRDKFHNLVVTVGMNDMLDKYFAGAAYTAAWFLGLAGVGTPATADTLASHAGWAEINPYTGNRPSIPWSAASGGSKNSPAVSFSITSSATVGGAFIASVNTGTAGILFSSGQFSASKVVNNGDTLNVTPTISL